MLGEKLFTIRFPAVEDNRNIIISRLPRIAKEFPGFGLKQRHQLVAEPVQRNPQWSPPVLIPARVTAAIAPAIDHPTPDSMNTAPGTGLVNLRLVSRRVLFKELAEIGQPGKLIRFNILEGIREGHFSMAMVMTIGFAIGCNMNQLVPLAFIVECA